MIVKTLFLDLALFLKIEKLGAQPICEAHQTPAVEISSFCFHIKSETWDRGVP